jgi:hypothetical protein
MSRHTVQQHRINHRGRDFHFVVYDGHPLDSGRARTETLPTWFMMASGKRWEVMPEVPNLPVEELDHRLTEWLDENVFEA